MRAQAAFEFSILVGMGMVLMIILVILAANMTYDRLEKQRTAALLELGYTIQDELILATTVQPGYEHDFLLPETLGRFNYAILTNATSLRLSSGAKTLSFPIPPITGTLTKGLNTIRYDGTLSVSQ